MVSSIYANVHVKDLSKSVAFFKKIGFTINEQFTDETGACVVISENIFAMLLTHEKFKMFTSKQITDAHKSTEVLLALQVESREKVNKVMNAALAAGATEARPEEDHGFMMSRCFNDLDGHIWEFFFMDITAFPKI